MAKSSICAVTKFSCGGGDGGEQSWRWGVGCRVCVALDDTSRSDRHPEDWYGHDQAHFLPLSEVGIEGIRDLQG
jgi:hypothetical protein